MRIRLYPILVDFEVKTLDVPYSVQLVRELPMWHWLSLKNFLFLLNLRRFESRGKIATPGMYYMTIMSLKIVDLYKARPEEVLTWL
jgi:hypothetical protein